MATQQTSLPAGLSDRILGLSPDAIVVCDPKGLVRFWNHGAERVFGFSGVEAVGASLDLIIPERLRARHWAGWTAVMRTGDTRYAEGQLLAVPALRKDGREISIEFSIQLLRSTNDQIEWIVAIIREVTERYASDKALRAQLKDLQSKTLKPANQRASFQRRQPCATEVLSPLLPASSSAPLSCHRTRPARPVTRVSERRGR